MEYHEGRFGAGCAIAPDPSPKVKTEKTAPNKNKTSNTVKYQGRFKNPHLPSIDISLNSAYHKISKVAKRNKTVKKIL